MNRDQKAVAIAEIAADIEQSQAVFAVDYRGLSVAQAAELRAQLRDADATLRVVKNSLTERAADQTGAGELKPLLQGPTALTFVRGDAALAAKAIADYARLTQLLPFKGGLMDGAALDPDQLSARSPACPHAKCSTGSLSASSPPPSPDLCAPSARSSAVSPWRSGRCASRRRPQTLQPRRPNDGNQPPGLDRGAQGLPRWRSPAHQSARGGFGVSAAAVAAPVAAQAVGAARRCRKRPPHCGRPAHRRRRQTIIKVVGRTPRLEAEALVDEAPKPSRRASRRTRPTSSSRNWRRPARRSS